MGQPASSPRERLFRDEAGAALERAARLVDENQQLREELARVQRPGRDATTVSTRQNPRPRPRVVLFFSVSAAVAGVLFSYSALWRPAVALDGFDNPPPRPRLPTPVVIDTTPPPPPPFVPPPGLLGASPTSRTIGTAATPGVLEDECATPYTYDDDGVKHYKQHCIHPERAGR